MPTVLFVRHGRSTANTSGVLAGWTPGVALDATGREQARTLGRRLSRVPLALVAVSPLQRCQETADLLLTAAGAAPSRVTEDALGECRYGDWTGRALSELVQEPLWPQVQAHPSAVTFPGPEGESMRTMQTRALEAVRRLDEQVRTEHGEGAVWLLVSHGDVIKSVLADALGMHLDAFQRLHVDPCSLSAVRYTRLRPFALRINDAGTDLAALVPPPSSPAADGNDSDAVVGGSAGTGGPHQQQPKP